MSYGQDIFPIITTKKIHVSTQDKKIKVDFCLNLPDSQQSRDSFGPIQESLYYYFAILDDSSANLLPNLKNPSSREAAVKSIMRGETTQHGRARMSLGDVFDNSRTLEYTQTDLSNDYQNEIRASVEVSYEVGREYENLQTDKLHLVCFAHTEITPSAETDSSIGSADITYDLLLERVPETSMLAVPEFVETFYIRDPASRASNSSVPGGSFLQPYFGPAHYHGEENPGPGGYIGWMSGHPNGVMGPKLEVRRTRNYKTSSDLALALTSTSDTYENDQSMTQVSDISLLPSSDLRQKIRHNNLIKTTENLMQTMMAHTKQHCLKRPNIVDYGANDATFINLVVDPDTGDGSKLEQSHHGCVAGINFLDLVRHRARLGYIVDFHYRLGNEDIVSECIYKSNIKNMKISRRRVVNRPYEINERQSKKYTKFEKNSQDVYIVSSSDEENIEESTNYYKKIKHRLFYGKSKKGTIEEVELMTAATRPDQSGASTASPGPKYSRQFIVRDRDLFHNFSYGKYTYVIDLMLNDGIYDMVSSLHAKSKKVLEEYNRFLFEAQIPVKVYPETREVTGNYDYSSKEFLGAFKVDPRNQAAIDQAIAHYGKIKRFLTGYPVLVVNTDMGTLKQRLNLNSGRLEDLAEFSNVMTELTNSIKHVLATGVDIGNIKAKNTEKSEVQSFTGGLKKSIEVSSPLGVFVEAFSGETLMADYGPKTKIVDSVNITAFSKMVKTRVSQGLFLKPDRFITIQPSNTSSDDSETPTIGKNKSSTTRKEKDKKSKSSSSSSKATVKEVSTRTSYDFLPTIAKSNVNLKLKYLFKSQAEGSVGEVDKPPSYYPPAIQRYHGGISVGLTKGGIVANTGDYEFLERILELTDADLSENIKKQICDSVYMAKDKDHFLEEVERRYEDLVKMRSLLDSFYETVHVSMMMKDTLYSINSHNTSYSDAFEGFSAPQSRGSTVELNPYETQSAMLQVVLPGQETVKLNDFKIEAPPAPNTLRGQKRLICVACAPNDREPGATPVNNVMFLEV
jgi:hypothetical protein